MNELMKGSFFEKRIIELCRKSTASWKEILSYYGIKYIWDENVVHHLNKVSPSIKSTSSNEI